MNHPARLVAILLLSSLVSAQNGLTGTWQGTTQGGSRIALDIVVKGTALAGTLTHNAERVPIADGKISKDTFTFMAAVDGRASEPYHGEFDGRVVKLWPDSLGARAAVTLRRAGTRAGAAAKQDAGK